MPEDKEARYALRIPASLMERMRAIAERNKRSLNREIELAIEQYLDRQDGDDGRR